MNLRTMLPEAQEWVKDAFKRNEKPMKESKIFASLVTDEFLKDPLCALQIGMAVMYNKPIVLIVDEKNKRSLPPKLTQIATMVKFVNFDDPDAMKRAVDAFQSIKLDDDDGPPAEARN